MVVCDFTSATASQTAEAVVDPSEAELVSYAPVVTEDETLLLVDLADVYFKSKKFSEALEILFEMGLQYPAVRQIQNAMQGVYSMVQESAGDVKVL